MSWMPRLAALLLAAVLGSAVFAQGAAAPSETTVTELRTRLDAVPTSVDTNAEVRELLARINEIGTQAD